MWRQSAGRKPARGLRPARLTLKHGRSRTRPDGQDRKEPKVEIPADVIGFAVVMATVFGAVFGAKLLVWGKGPIRRIRGGNADPAADERLAELEQRFEQLSEFVGDQSRMLEDYHERLDFTERVLTQQQRGEEGKALEPPPGER